MDERLLPGRTTQGVVRIGATVRRPARGKRLFRHECLQHLEHAGFEESPRFLGFDEAGREVLSFLPGDVPAELGHYADHQLIAAAKLLRRFHDATATMEAVKAAGFEIACHNDWAPTNAVFENGCPRGLIDFDTLAPGPRLWDLGYSAFTWLDLGNDDYSPEEQRRRLDMFVGAYDVPDCTAAEVAVYAVARQTALAASAAAQGNMDMARWASAAAHWTALHLLQSLLPK